LRAAGHCGGRRAFRDHAGERAGDVAPRHQRNRDPIIDWFAGSPGDTSHPFRAYDPSFTFTPATIGTQKIWARVQNDCNEFLDVEFRADVIAASRCRTARH
jgi:hypothetical protein